jgi:hypothetical protein
LTDIQEDKNYKFCFLENFQFQVQDRRRVFENGSCRKLWTIGKISQHITSMLFGILLSVFIMISIHFGYRKFIAPESVAGAYGFAKIDTNLYSKKLLPSELNQLILELKITDKNLEEKIASANKRWDDFLVFGGIIITLLLAIYVGQFLQTQSVVRKRFEKNFEKYKQQIINYVTDSEAELNKIKTNVDLSNQMARQKTNQKGTGGAVKAQMGQNPTP